MCSRRLPGRAPHETDEAVDPGLRRRRGVGPDPRCLRQQRFELRFLRPSDAHLLGQQPGHQPAGRPAGPGPADRQVHQADRHQGQGPGHPLDDPAHPDHGGHGVGQGPRRPQHRQHLVRIAPGDRRLPALHVVGHEPDRRLQPVPGRQPLGHRRGRQAADGGAALQHGLRPVLQQGRVRGGGHQRAARDLDRFRGGRQEADQGRALRADPRGRPDPGERPPGVRAEPAAGRGVLQRGGQAHVQHPAERGRGQADDRLHADRQDRQPERRAVLQGHRGADRLRHREGRHGLLADGVAGRWPSWA